MRTLVTNAEIEEVGESLIRRFIGKRKPLPNCIDIEGFITDYLHLPVVYAGIAEEDRDKIGLCQTARIRWQYGRTENGGAWYSPRAP